MRVFEERQHFNQWWLWPLFIIPLGAMLYNPAKAIWLSGTFSLSHFNSDFWIGFSIFIAAHIFLKICNLQTTINENGIAYRFFPFQKDTRRINWSNINKIAVVHYNPILEYGGWGYRFGRKGKALNVRGNKGIKFTFNGKETLLLGTQQPEQAKIVIERYFKHERV